MTILSRGSDCSSPVRTGAEGQETHCHQTDDVLVWTGRGVLVAPAQRPRHPAPAALGSVSQGFILGMLLCRAPRSGWEWLEMQY
jgi:hypothetical protein